MYEEHGGDGKERQREKKTNNKNTFLKKQHDERRGRQKRGVGGEDGENVSCG